MAKRAVRPAFAKRLREAMTDAGKVREKAQLVGPDIYQLADFLGISRQMASRYLDGESLPDPEKIAQLAKWLNVRLAWLRDGEGTKTEATKEDVARNESERKLLRLFRRCREDQCDHILQYLTVIITQGQ